MEGCGNRKKNDCDVEDGIEEICEASGTFC